MTITTLSILLGCAFGWAGLDLWRKFLAGRLAALPASLVLVVGQVPLFAIWALAGGAQRLEAGYWLPGLASVVVNLLANVAFMQSMRAAPLSRTIPLLSLTPVFASLVAIWTLGEMPSAREWIGILLVVAGALWLGRDDAAVAGEFWRTLARRGGLLMAFVALCWSITPSLDKLALGHATPAIHALVVVLGIAVGLGVVLARLGRFDEVRVAISDPKTLGLVALAVATGALATGLQLLAYQRLPVGLVETVKRGIGPLTALGFGAWLFAETVGRGRIVAVAGMIVGVALVLL